MNFAGTASPTSLFLLPVTCASSLFSAFASRKFFTVQLLQPGHMEEN